MITEHITSFIDHFTNRQPGGILAAGFENLSTGESYYYNENHVFPAASIVKIPIMLEYLSQRDRGLQKDDSEVVLKEEDIVGGAGILFEMHRGLVLTKMDLLRLMIVISDNTASNLMLDITGMDEVNAFMASLGFLDTVIGRKFMIDPNTKFSKNFCTVGDMTRLLAKLYRGEILSEKSRADAIEILSRQQYREKIPLLLPQKLKICHKTGEITGVRHDCALVLHEKSPYALSIFTEKLPDVISADRLIAEMSLLFFEIIDG